MFIILLVMKKSQVNKVENNIKKTAKKNPKEFAIGVVILIVFAIIAAVVYFVFIKEPQHDLDINGKTVMSLEIGEVYHEDGATATYKNEDVSDKIEFTYRLSKKDGEIVTSIDTSEECCYYVVYSISYEKWSEEATRIVYVGTEPISVNFLELGNYHTGDCTYIKAGQTDILIDAGSKKGSAETIANFLNQPGRVEDGIIEYVIATHRHEDHIAGFVGSKDCPGIFDRYSVTNIIKYSQIGSASALNTEFETKVQQQVGKGANLILADKAVGNIYDLAGGTTLQILDQKYYHESDRNNENNHSVCALISHGEYNYLFTGDLEAEGEASLLEKNPDLPHVQLFKGAHHGSYTANSEALLNKITPDVICICCCAGNDEYTSVAANMFPAQETINRMAVYTKEIYVTTVTTDGHEGFKSLNGDITFSSPTGKTYTVMCSVDNHILKESNWFTKNRTWPANGK